MGVCSVRILTTLGEILLRFYAGRGARADFPAGDAIGEVRENYGGFEATVPPSEHDAISGWEVEVFRGASRRGPYQTTKEKRQGVLAAPLIVFRPVLDMGGGNQSHHGQIIVQSSKNGKP